MSLGVSRLPPSLMALVTLYAVVAVAPLLTPYDPDAQHRAWSFAPPTRMHVVDAQGRWRRPFVYAEPTDPRAPLTATPIRFLTTSVTSGLNGQLERRTRLFGVDPPAHIFLLGTDRYGRDQWSRLLVGARTSLGAGLLAASLSIGLGALLGGVAGASRGWVDRVIMRAIDLFIAVPWLYLLLAVRAALPIDMPPARAFGLLAMVIGIAGWARPALLIRSVVLSARERGYVVAARGCGASEWYVLRRHILPQAMGVMLTQGAILAPQFTLAEMTLSFFGLGLAAPLASWGTLLADVSRDHLLQPSWYAAAPVVAVVAVFVLYQSAADAVRARAAEVAW